MCGALSFFAKTACVGRLWIGKVYIPVEDSKTTEDIPAWTRPLASRRNYLKGT